MNRSVEEIKKSITAIKQADEELCLPPNETLMQMLDTELRATLTDGIPLSDLETLCAAWKDGRCVVLPPAMESDYDGLKVKYRVFKAKNNELVENCFVLRPDKDPAAMAALFAYADSTANGLLRDDILDWIDGMKYEAGELARAEAEAALQKGEDA